MIERWIPSFESYSRGKWGGLTAVFISQLTDQSLSSTKRHLYVLRDKLGRYPNRREIGRFIAERINRADECKDAPRSFVHY